MKNHAIIFNSFCLHSSFYTERKNIFHTHETLLVALALFAVFFVRFFMVFIILCFSDVGKKSSNIVRDEEHKYGQTICAKSNI